MSPPPSYFEVRLERVTEPTTGLWCERCLLPSVVEFQMAMMHGDRILHIGPYSRCSSGCDDGSVLSTEMDEPSADD